MISNPSRILAATYAALVACNSKSTTTSAQPDQVTHTGDSRSTPAPAPNGADFGGGYKDAKWGMSEQQVTQALGANKTGTEATQVVGTSAVLFDLGADKKATCFFVDNRLYRVEYKPHLPRDREQESIKAILTALSSKYGNGVPFRREELLPVVGYTWSDSRTRVQFEQPDPKVMNQFSYSFGAGPVTVVYVSLQLEAEVERRRTAAKADERKRDEERLQKRAGEVGKDL